MSNAGTDVIDALLRDNPGLGRKITVTTTTGAGTAATTDAVIRKQLDLTFYRGQILHIPSESIAADQTRTIAKHAFTGGTTTFTFDDTTNFTNAVTSAAAYVLNVHPDTWIAIMNRALTELRVRVRVPLRHGPNSADMQGSAVDSDWMETNATDTVQTTGTEVLSNAQSFQVVDSGSGNGYTKSAQHKIGQGKSIQLHMLAKADVGTIKLDVVDGTSNSQGTLSTTQEQWVYGTKRVQFDSADELFDLRLTSVTANAEGDWQAAWFVRIGEYRFRLPSWILDNFTIEGLSRAIYYEGAPDSGSSDSLFLAESVEYRALNRNLWKVHKYAADVGTRTLTLVGQGQNYIGEPLFLTVSCPWSEPYGVSTTFTDFVTGTTLCPLDALVAKTLELLAESQGWTDLVQKAQQMTVETFLEDEEEEFTADIPEPWRGPAGMLIP